MGANDSPSLHIGKLPGRSSVALYEANGCVRVFAYFRSEQAAERAVYLIDWIAGISRVAPNPINAAASGPNKKE